MSAVTSGADIAVPAPAPGHGGWPAALAALTVAAGGLIAFYWDTAALMVRIWERSETFTHCFLIPPLALWLALRRRSTLSAMPVRPWWPVLGVMLLMAGVWLLAQLAAINALSQLTFTAMVVLTVPLILGKRVAQEIAFPLMFLFFSVPVGEFMIPVMMEWTADFTVMALRLSRIPVYREGLQFVLSSGNWSVVEACSGVRYLIASITVGTLFAYLNFFSLKKRLLFCLVAVAVPVLANWLRAYMIVMLGHLSSNQLAVGADHLVYGWAFFGVVIFLMFMVGARWREDAPVETAAPQTSEALPVNVPLVWGTAALALALTALAPWHYQSIVSGEQLRGVQTLALPRLAGAGEWKNAPDGEVPWRPVYAAPSAEMTGGYRREDQSVDLYVAYYRNQTGERKLISSTNVLVVSKDPVWTLAGRGAHSVALDGQQFDLRTALLRPRPAALNPGINKVIWKWYWIDGTFTGNDYLARIFIVLSRLRGRGDSAAAIVLGAHGQGAAAEAALESFSLAHGTALNAWLKNAAMPLKTEEKAR